MWCASEVLGSQRSPSMSYTLSWFCLLSSSQAAPRGKQAGNKGRMCLITAGSKVVPVWAERSEDQFPRCGFQFTASSYLVIDSPPPFEMNFSGPSLTPALSGLHRSPISLVKTIGHHVILGKLQWGALVHQSRKAPRGHPAGKNPCPRMPGKFWYR